jgi:hypothetical protein
LPASKVALFVLLEASLGPQVSRRPEIVQHTHFGRLHIPVGLLFDSPFLVFGRTEVLGLSLFRDEPSKYVLGRYKH